MVPMWEGVLRRHGQELTLRSGNQEKRIRAFLQPVDEKAPGLVPTVLGVAAVGKYLYLGPPEQKLNGIDEIGWNDRSFRVLRHRGYWIGNQMIYRWAVCEEMDAAPTEVCGC